MQEILTKNFGKNWPEAMKTYQTALNSMDRGVTLRQ